MLVAIAPTASAAVATAAAATPAAPAATAATTTAGALLRDADLQRAAVDVAAVGRLDGRVGLRRAGHLDEGEAARLAGVAIGDDLQVDDLAAVFFERLLEGLVSGAK